MAHLDDRSEFISAFHTHRDHDFINYVFNTDELEVLYSLLDGTRPYVGAVTINGSSDTTQLTVRGHAVQTGNLQVWTDFSGLSVASVSYDGVPTSAKHLTTKEYVDANDFWTRTGTTLTPETSGDDVTIDGTLKAQSLTETKVTSSTTETLSVLNSTYINIDIAGNTLTLSNMIDGSLTHINNASSGGAILGFKVKIGATTFPAGSTMPSGDSYTLIYDLASTTWT